LEKNQEMDFRTKREEEKGEGETRHWARTGSEEKKTEACGPSGTTISGREGGQTERGGGKDMSLRGKDWERSAKLPFT